MPEIHYSDAASAESTPQSLPLSVVVCTYNRALLLEECLESLRTQTLAADEFEVIVVDNNSSDQTAAILAEWSRCWSGLRVFAEKKQGLSHARNCGWQVARGEVVAYIDDDAVAAPDWCLRIVQLFRSLDPSPAAVGGIIAPRLKGSPPCWYSPRLEMRHWGDTAGYLPSAQARYGFSGSNMAIRRDHLVSLGGFDPALGMRGDIADFGEETDFFVRLYQRAPAFWYDPDIRVFHLVNDGQLRLSGRLRRVFRAGRARRRFERTSFTLSMLMAEASGLWQSLITVARDRSFPLRSLFVAMAERVANRLGFLTGRGA